MRRFAFLSHTALKHPTALNHPTGARPQPAGPRQRSEYGQRITDKTQIAYSERSLMDSNPAARTEVIELTRKVCSKLQCSLLSVLLTLVCFPGCSSTIGVQHVQNSTPVKITPGSVLIAKKLPPITEIDQIPLYGFLPLPPIHQTEAIGTQEAEKSWLEINSSAGQVTAKNSMHTVFQMRLQFEDIFQELHFEKKTEVVMVSDNPVWIAPAEYFLARGLPVPPEGDSRRFLEGILGSHAIYLSNGQVIHSGPSQAQTLDPSTRVNGYRVAPEKMRDLLRHVKVGMPVIVR